MTTRRDLFPLAGLTALAAWPAAAAGKLPDQTMRADQAKVTPNPGDLARIKADQERINAARGNPSAAEDFLVPFVWPAHGPISGVYGSQRILNGARPRHRGARGQPGGRAGAGHRAAGRA